MYYVKYIVQGYDQPFYTEGYLTHSIAYNHQCDILGYEGILWSKIVTQKDETILQKVDNIVTGAFK